MRKIIFYSVSVILIVILITTVVFWWKIRAPLNPAGETIIFKVEKGQSAKTVADNLVKTDLIKNPFIFRFYVYLALSQYVLKPGEFEFSPAMSIREIADSIIIGGTNEVLITIPEGFTLGQIEERFVAAKLAKPGEIVSLREIPRRGIICNL